MFTIPLRLKRLKEKKWCVWKVEPPRGFNTEHLADWLFTDDSTHLICLRCREDLEEQSRTKDSRRRTTRLSNKVLSPPRLRVPLTHADKSCRLGWKDKRESRLDLGPPRWNTSHLRAASLAESSVATIWKFLLAPCVFAAKLGRDPGWHSQALCFHGNQRGARARASAHPPPFETSLSRRGGRRWLC